MGCGFCCSTDGGRYASSLRVARVLLLRAAMFIAFIFATSGASGLSSSSTSGSNSPSSSSSSSSSSTASVLPLPSAPPSPLAGCFSFATAFSSFSFAFAANFSSFAFAFAAAFSSFDISRDLRSSSCSSHASRTSVTERSLNAPVLLS